MVQTAARTPAVPHVRDGHMSPGVQPVSIDADGVRLSGSDEWARGRFCSRGDRCAAVNGKTVRGARRADGTQVHRLAAMTGTGLVTAQREVGSKTNEITVFPANLLRPSLPL